MLKEIYNLPIKVNGKTKRTWVNELPPKLLNLVWKNGGKLGPDRLVLLKQKDRSIVVPLGLHPLTSKKCEVKNVWKVLNKTAGKNKPRIGTDSSTENSASDIDDTTMNIDDMRQVANELLDMADEASKLQRADDHADKYLEQQPNKRQREESETCKSARAKTKVVLQKQYVETKLLPLLKDVNLALNKIPQSYTRSDAMTVYDELCVKNKLLHSATNQALFRLDNFIRCLDVRFPETMEANITVRYIIVL